MVGKAREPYHEVQPEKTAQQSVTYFRNHVFARSAVQDERGIPPNGTALPSYVAEVIGIAAPVVTPRSVATTGNVRGVRP